MNLKNIKFNSFYLKSSKAYDQQSIRENQSPNDFKKIKQIYRGDPTIPKESFQQASLFDV